MASPPSPPPEQHPGHGSDLAPGVSPQESDASTAVSIGQIHFEPLPDLEVVAFEQQTPPRTRAPSEAVVGPPVSLDPAAIYTLYRGVTGREDGQAHRVWIEFPAAQLCWARYDLPARVADRLRLTHLSHCRLGAWDEGQWPPQLILQIYETGDADQSGCNSCASSIRERPRQQRECDLQARRVLQVVGPSNTLQEFAEALGRLIKCRNEEGHSVLDFIQRRLFQYLWVRQGCLRSEEEMLEAQAVLAFNIHPKEGVAYLRSKLFKSSDAVIGDWLADMSSNKGGIDPTILGNYFSRPDTVDITQNFISRLDFQGLDILQALRKLFDYFKPGGESQVFYRILEFFAVTYLGQWQMHASEVLPKVAYKSSDSVLQISFSLIMLNTGLHVYSRKATSRDARCAPCRGRPQKRAAVMSTVEDYIHSARSVVVPEEVPEEALRFWYKEVSECEISLEPLPRVPFSTLPVMPDIEGWLTVVLGPRARRRTWAVLALQRLYLFSDRSEDLEPTDVIDLKDMTICSIAHSAVSRERLRKELHLGGMCLGACLAAVPDDLPEIVVRGFELRRQGARENIVKSVIQLKHSKPLANLVLAAETPDLMDRWVGLISSGPH